MMPEERLDRLERITKLMVKAGLRARQQMREQDQKIGILIDAQLKNEERFGKLVEAQTRLIDPQTHTDQRLDALIDIIQKGETENLPPKESVGKQTGANCLSLAQEAQVSPCRGDMFIAQRTDNLRRGSEGRN